MDSMWHAFLDNQTRIEAFALRRGNRSRERFIAQGHDHGELDPHALINAVWSRHLEGTTVWDPAEKTIFKFFCDEIHNRVRSFEQKAPGFHLRIVTSRDPGPSEISDEVVTDGGLDVRRMMEGLETSDLLQFIHCHNSKLVLLAQSIIHGYSIAEQAKIIERHPSTRLRWENELVELVQSFREQIEPLIAVSRDIPPDI